MQIRIAAIPFRRKCMILVTPISFLHKQDHSEIVYFLQITSVCYVLYRIIFKNSYLHIRMVIGLYMQPGLPFATCYKNSQQINKDWVKISAYLIQLCHLN